MTAQIHLGLEPNAFGHGAVIACNVISEAARTIQSVPVSAGSSAAVEVDEGHYVVQAMLPTGETVTRTAHVDAGGNARVEIGRPGEGVKVQARRAPQPRHPRPGKRDSGEAVRDLTSDDARRRDDVTDGEDGMSAEEIAGVIEGLGEKASLHLVEPSRMSGSRYPVWVGLWRGKEYVPWELKDIQKEPGAATFEIPRNTADAIHVAPLQGASRIAWLAPSGGGVVTMRRTRGHGFDDGVRVDVTSPSAMAAAIASYLAAGQVDAAGTLAPTVVARARQMFKGKLRDPDGAAVASYFLLRVGQQESLKDWPANFAEWFPDLPDAAVIHAWQLLRRPGVPDRDLALERLRDAVLAGIPRYTEGLRLLFQGLQILETADPPSNVISGLLEKVRPYAAACDWNSVHTTYWGTAPTSPNLKRFAGPPDSRGSWSVLL